MSSLSVSGSGLPSSGGAGAPLSVTGLASGLDTKSIINALLEVERQPIHRLTAQEEKLTAEQSLLQTIQQSLQKLEFAVSEFALPSVFESAQSVTSSEPTRVSATTGSGAGVGGYEIEVKALANSAQRTFAYKSPAGEDTVTIDSRQYTLKAGATAQELAGKVNADASATVYAAVVGETIVFSNRATGATEGKFIAVADTAGALSEKAATAKEGRNAEYTLDGVAATSATNVVTSAIPGVTLTLSGITSSGPVTIAVQAPALNTTAVEEKVKSFVSLYNSTVEAIQKQLSAKPPLGATNSAAGSLFGDQDLSSLLSRMRQTMYQPIAGLAAEMASPADVGISTGAPAGTSSQSSLEGQLTLDAAKFTSALQANPQGAQQMLQKWSASLQGLLTAAAAPGGTLDTRASGDGAQATQLKSRIATMNQMLEVRQRALVQTYARLETVISQNSSQSSWLTNQSEQLNKSGF